MKSITLTAYNRPKYFSTTIEHILKNNIEKYYIFVRVEPSPLLDQIINIFDNINHNNKQITINQSRLGHRRNQYESINDAFVNGSVFNIHFDDDLFISQDATNLADWYYENYKNDPLKYLNYGLFNYGSNSENPNNITVIENGFVGLGWASFKENWEYYFKPNWFKDDLSIKHNGTTAIGWDWQMTGLAKEFNLKSLMPTYSRTNHNGRENGTCCDYNHHDKSFSNLNWNDDKIIKDFKIIKV